MSLPLSGVKVIAFEQYGAGPFGTQYLADMGADVIKVEPAGTSGDYLRDIGPYFIDGDNKNSASSIFFQAEDGIRAVERSRGLGDVYKRQFLEYNFTFLG